MNPEPGNPPQRRGPKSYTVNRLLGTYQLGYLYFAAVVFNAMVAFINVRLGFSTAAEDEFLNSFGLRF